MEERGAMQLRESRLFVVVERGRPPSLPPLRTLLCLCVAACLALPANGDKCYSCMSEFYGQMWELANYKALLCGLWTLLVYGMGFPALYLLPKRSEARTLSFTDQCRDPSQRPRDIATQHCGRGALCISMKEKLKLGFGTYGYIRGCVDGVFLWGYNRTGRGKRLWSRPGCEIHNLSSLVQGHEKGSFHDSELLVCTCNGGLCNDGDQVASAALSCASLLLPVSLFLLLRTAL